MSTEISPYSQVNVEPVNHHPPSDNRDNDLSSASAKYEDLVLNSTIFWDKLRALLGFTSTTLKVPTVGGSILDLHHLFVEVTSRGGFQKVIDERKWKEVMGAINLPTTITSASFVLKRIYSRFLYQLEHVYYFKKALDSMPPTDEAMASLANISLNPEEENFAGNAEPQIGCTVDGVIDAKFESGYLVTVKIGDQEMKGVLYHIPVTPSYPQRTRETVSSTVAPPSTHRRGSRKKAKLAAVDSQKPKCHRSGYNFFFAEQYAKLRPAYQGQERAITKKIGYIWSNLSESERQVYKEKGAKDVERYRIEMSEYKSSHESGAAAAAAAPAATNQ